MREGLYVHIDDVKDVIDTHGNKGGTGMVIINEEFILTKCRERSDFYVTHGGNLIRRTR